LILKGLARPASGECHFNLAWRLLALYISTSGPVPAFEHDSPKDVVQAYDRERPVTDFSKIPMPTFRSVAIDKVFAIAWRYSQQVARTVMMGCAWHASEELDQ
jgi:hypothetical protein